MLGRAVAKDAANFVIDGGVGGMIFAIHFKINAKGGPAGTKIRLPLQFHIAARDRQRVLNAILVVKADRPFGGINVLHGHIKHAAGVGMDGQEDGIALAALFAQTGQHHFHDLVIFFCRLQQDGVKAA